VNPDLVQGRKRAIRKRRDERAETPVEVFFADEVKNKYF